MSEDRGLLVGAQRIKDFVFGGKAVFTLVSGRTGARFTYRVVRAPGEDDGRPWFVKVLTGSDNDADYRYAGFILGNCRYDIRRGRKGMSPTAPSLVALRWFLSAVVAESEAALAQVECWHEGRCGRCGRRLTVPESVETGLGPVCAGKEV